MVTPSRGVLHQPSERSHRPGRDQQAAARRVHFRGQEGDRAGPGDRAAVPHGRCRVPRPRGSCQGDCGAAAGRGQVARGHVGGDLAGGHPVGDPDGRPVQERRLPPGDAGRRAHRADRHPQRRRDHVAGRQDRAERHHRRDGAPANPHGRLDTGRPQRGRGAGPAALRRHPRGLADSADRRGRHVMSGTRHALDHFGLDVRRRIGPRGLMHRVGLLGASTEPLSSDTAEVAHLLGAPAFRSQVGNLAGRLGRPEEDVLAEAAGDLREMSATHNEAVIAQWQRFGQWMRRGYDTLLDEEALAGLRELDRKHSLIFLISHRSYLDEWVLPPALVSSGISPPYGLAGANLNFFPLGTVARRTGVVHIRRSTSDAPVYRLALRAYIGQLVANRANLVWSIEGGRSRTGKLRPPRYGLAALRGGRGGGGRCARSHGRAGVDRLRPAAGARGLADDRPRREGWASSPRTCGGSWATPGGCTTVSAGYTSISGSRYGYGSGWPSCASMTRRKRMPSSGSRWRCRTGSTGRRR